MRIRGVVLEQTGGPLDVSELELAAPRPEEVLVRLHASGVCHSDYNAIDGTSETVCPAVLGHEGAGVVEASARTSLAWPSATMSRCPGHRGAEPARNAHATSRSCAPPCGPRWQPEG